MMDNFTSDEECIDAIAYQSLGFFREDPNVAGIIVILVFYVLIFVVGVLASWLKKRKKQLRGRAVSTLNKVEDLVLAGRDMGPAVGILTITATEIGGGMLNGTAEVMMNPALGLIWCQAPFFYPLSIILNSFIFIKPMRERNYRTMLDPIQERFGRIQTIFTYLPHMMSDIFWSASILTALGSSLSVIIGINYLWSVVISAGVVVIYTIVGGLYSVAYTDIIELAFLGIGMWLAVPFAMMHPASSPISETGNNANSTWLGQPLEGLDIARYIDIAVVLTTGAFTWQPLHQRTLAMKSTKQAMMVAGVGGLVCFVFLTPVFLLGAVAYSTDWNATDYTSIGSVPVPECNYPLALPMVMRFLTPEPVAVIGLGAVSAAVMSSTDSAVLSSASLITLNIYSPIRLAAAKGIKASDKELLWVMRIVVIFIGAIATIIALFVAQTYGLLVMSGEFTSIFILPQLTSAVFLPFTNSYGSVAAFWVGLILRLLSGEPLTGLPTIIYWPYADGEMQLFPFRTLLIILSFVAMISISLISRECAKRFVICRKMDAKMFRCFVSENNSNAKTFDVYENDLGENDEDTFL